MSEAYSNELYFTNDVQRFADETINSRLANTKRVYTAHVFTPRLAKTPIEAIIVHGVDYNWMSEFIDNLNSCINDKRLFYRVLIYGLQMFRKMDANLIVALHWSLNIDVLDRQIVMNLDLPAKELIYPNSSESLYRDPIMEIWGDIIISAVQPKALK